MRGILVGDEEQQPVVRLEKLRCYQKEVENKRYMKLAYMVGSRKSKRMVDIRSGCGQGDYRHV